MTNNSDKLPQIDTGISVPSQRQVEGWMHALAQTTAEFVEQYKGYEWRLSQDGLVDAVQTYAHIQELSARLVHVAEYSEEKYPNNGQVISQILKKSADTNVAATGFFFDHLLHMPLIEIDDLRERSELKPYATFLRFFMQPAFRDRSLPTNDQRLRYLDHIRTHLRNLRSDAESYQALHEMLPPIVKAFNAGYSSPLRHQQHVDFVQENEAHALRKALANNMAFIRTYLRQRNIVNDISEKSSREPIYVPNQIDWSTTQSMTIQTLTALSPALGHTAENLFRRGLVNVVPQNSYTAIVVASRHMEPYVFLGFEGSLFNAQEAAHAIGNAVHFVKRSESQELRPFHTPAIDQILPDVEERLFWQNISRQTNNAFRSLAAGDIGLDNMVSFVGRYFVIDSFQHYVSNLLNGNKPFRAKDLHEKWAGLQKEVFGSNSSDIDETSWQHSPFLTSHPHQGLSSMYAQLAAERMWQEHCQDPKRLEPKLLTFLEAGSSKPPVELLAMLGFKTSDPQFWSEAFRDLRTAVAGTSPHP